MVDTNIKFSRADQLTQHLTERCGRLPAGGKFLSVRQIMDEFCVSQITVKQAIERLCESGVLEAQDRRGYFVRRARRYGKIAALVPRLQENNYEDDFREHFSREAASSGFEFEIFTYENSEEVIYRLGELKADAILFRPYSHEALTAARLNRIMAIPVPVILVHNTVPIENCRYVDSDNEFCGILGATHLMINGHRKLALFLSEPDLPSIRQRSAGFLKCAAAYNVKVELLDPEIQVGEHSPSRSREFMEQYLREHPKPEFTGLFVLSELPALEVLAAIRQSGLSVPGDISLIAVGHSLHESGVGLTTINTRRDQVIHHALEIVKRHFENSPGALEQYKVTPEIHSGNTVLNLR